MSERVRIVPRVGAFLAMSLSACVLHQPGLSVEVALDMHRPPALASATITQLELVPCPGSTDPSTHVHDESAPFAIALGDTEPVWLAPRVGRYCDLRIQIEGSEVATRQGVLPLVCEGARVELRLEARDIDRRHALLVRSTSDLIAPEDPPQRALERLLRTLEVDACD